MALYRDTWEITKNPVDWTSLEVGDRVYYEGGTKEYTVVGLVSTLEWVLIDKETGHNTNEEWSTTKDTLTLCPEEITIGGE